MRIAFVSGKGGVGKSTLCYGVALALAHTGKSIAIEDRDPQQSVTGWLDPERDQVSELEGEITLIDTRPAIDDPTVINAIEGADVIVMPSTPSPADLTAGRATADVIRSHKRRGAKTVVVLNRMRKRTFFSDHARDVVGALGIKPAHTTIPDRQCIQRIVLGGWKEMDLDTRAEFLRLSIELLSL